MASISDIDKLTSELNVYTIVDLRDSSEAVAASGMHVVGARILGVDVPEALLFLFYYSSLSLWGLS